MRLGLAVFAVVCCGCGGGPAPQPKPKGLGESCEMPFMLSGTELQATTTGFTDDEGEARSPCGGDGAPDLVVQLAAPADARLTLTVTPRSPGFQPIVKVRSAAKGCVEQDEACSSSTARGKPAQIDEWPVALGGNQYVVIDGQSQTAGDFTLKVVMR